MGSYRESLYVLIVEFKKCNIKEDENKYLLLDMYFNNPTQAKGSIKHAIKENNLSGIIIDTYEGDNNYSIIIRSEDELVIRDLLISKVNRCVALLENKKYSDTVYVPSFLPDRSTIRYFANLANFRESDICTVSDFSYKRLLYGEKDYIDYLIDINENE